MSKKDSISYHIWIYEAGMTRMFDFVIVLRMVKSKVSNADKS